MNYRREIDGLRAFAVLPVMLFHADFQTFSGGFVGVDIFFVISGYLITSIILEEQQAGTLTLVGFYERRARRILPALFVVMIVAALATREKMDGWFACWTGGRERCNTYIEGNCAVQVNGESLYRDEFHLSNLGARLVVREIMRHIDVSLSERRQLETKVE